MDNNKNKLKLAASQKSSFYKGPFPEAEGEI
jgi:hypothetical protein